MRDRSRDFERTRVEMVVQLRGRGWFLGVEHVANGEERWPVGRAPERVSLGRRIAFLRLSRGERASIGS